MPQIIVNEKIESTLNKLHYRCGDQNTMINMNQVRSRKLFDEEVIEFLEAFSKKLLKDRKAKSYPDVITLAFWIRKAHVLKLKERYSRKSERYEYLGRGVVFHIAPSNVPINFAYSLVTGLLTGNANIVKVSSKDFPQVDLLVQKINEVLEEDDRLKAYIAIIQYHNDRDITELLSSICNVRVIWGGDETIERIRKAELSPRSKEITFADRYSLCAIDAEEYCRMEDQTAVARKFYNDTYLSDQNACTAPRMILWHGNQIAEAREKFWDELYHIVDKEYVYQDIYSMNKLATGDIAAAQGQKIRKISGRDNKIYRMEVKELDQEINHYYGNCGYFYEYCLGQNELLSDCIMKIADNVKCQTISYVGEKKKIRELMETLINEGCQGVDRIVPVGNTMDFDLIWDGYDLVEEMTRRMAIR